MAVHFLLGGQFLGLSGPFSHSSSSNFSNAGCTSTSCSILSFNFTEPAGVTGRAGGVGSTSRDMMSRNKRNFKRPVVVQALERWVDLFKEKIFLDRYNVSSRQRNRKEKKLARGSYKMLFISFQPCCLTVELRTLRDLEPFSPSEAGIIHLKLSLEEIVSQNSSFARK